MFCNKLISFSVLFLLPVFMLPVGGESLDIDSENIDIEEYNDHDNYDNYDDYFLYEAPDLVIEAPPFELRSFDDIFPELSRRQKYEVMSGSGFRHAFERDGSPMLVPNPDSGIDLLTGVMQKRPSHVIEVLLVVPYDERELDILDIYNALGGIKDIKDQKLHLRSGNTVNIFKETTRLESARNRRAVPDPAPADMLPLSETMFLRFTDEHIGNIYLRGDISVSLYGITYHLTNFRDINFSIFRIMRAERISIILYLEPVKEGVLIYSMSGLYLPGFIVNRMNLTPNIYVRILSLMNWITEGLQRESLKIQDLENQELENQENITAESENELLIREILQKSNFDHLLNLAE